LVAGRLAALLMTMLRIRRVQVPLPLLLLLPCCWRCLDGRCHPAVMPLG
jgi:hypothetical protein